MSTSLTPDHRFGIGKSNSIILPNPPEADGAEKWMLCPTLEAGAELQYAYQVLNEGLFDGKLPNCLITHTRKSNVFGYFCPDRYQKVDGELWPELAMNPIYLALRSDRESLSTLAHEMCHVERHYLGPLNRKGGRGTDGYHDRPWVEIMKRIGLQPSHNGLPDGDETGYRMTHYIIVGDAFDQLSRELINNGFKITWADNVRPITSVGGGDEPNFGSKTPAQKAKKNRAKFTCPQCRLNAWAKPSARLVCGNCGIPIAA